MGHCCCGAHSCTTENKKNASTSIVHEYWKVGLSFILLIGAPNHEERNLMLLADTYDFT